MIYPMNKMENPDIGSNEIISTEDYKWNISDGDYVSDSVEQRADFLTVKRRAKKIFFITATVLSGILVLLISRLLISV